MSFTQDELDVMQAMVDSQPEDLQTLSDQIAILEEKRLALTELDEIYLKFLTEQSQDWMKTYIQTQKILNKDPEVQTATSSPTFDFICTYQVAHVDLVRVNLVPTTNYTFVYGQQKIVVGGTWPGVTVEVRYTPRMVFTPLANFPGTPPEINPNWNTPPDGTPWGEPPVSIYDWEGRVFPSQALPTPDPLGDLFYSPRFNWDNDNDLRTHMNYFVYMRPFREAQGRGTRHIVNGIQYLLSQMSPEVGLTVARNASFNNFLP